MSRIIGSVCKLCRRENMKLYLKGYRCMTDKCAFERRPYPPGQHGQSRLKFSEYALQLREKQKAKRYYGVYERQFYKYFEWADSGKTVTSEMLLQLLETRLDNVVTVMGFASSRREAKQVIKHNHIKVNGKIVNIPSYNVTKDDVVEVNESSRTIARIMSAVESAKQRELPKWVSVELDNYKGTIKDLPVRQDVTLPIEENMIVELYSR